MLAKAKAITVIHEDRKPAMLLRLAPDGSKAAFFVPAQGTDFGTVRLRVVDLKTKTVIDSEAFQTDDDIPYRDGGFLFHWDAKSKGLFYHVVQGVGNILVYFDLEKRSSRNFCVDRDLGIVSVLDDACMAVYEMNSERRSAILRITDGKLFRLPENLVLLGGSGSLLAVANQQSGAVNFARFEIRN